MIWPVGLLAAALVTLEPSLRPESLAASSPSDWTDTDGDGIPDAQERVLGTSIYVADTDGDGFSDAEELARGTSPLDPLDYPLASTNGQFRIGMTARGEDGLLRLHLALYSPHGDFSSSVLRLGALAGGNVISVPLERLLPYAVLRDSDGTNGSVVRTIDLDLNPIYVHSFGAATFFVAVGQTGDLHYHSAAKVDLYSVEQTLLLRRAPPLVSQQGVPQNGGTMRQPIPTAGLGSIPNTWLAGQICYQRSNVTGIMGAKVVHEIVRADCLSGWDTFCPTDCPTSIGATYETIDPATLIGG